MDAKKTARIGTLRNAVTEQVVDGVDVDAFLSEIDDPANWEGDDLPATVVKSPPVKSPPVDEGGTDGAQE